MTDALSEVLAAESRLRPFVNKTPARFSSVLSEKAGCEAYLKLEHLQVTGSFKGLYPFFSG